MLLLLLLLLLLVLLELQLCVLLLRASPPRIAVHRHTVSRLTRLFYIVNTRRRSVLVLFSHPRSRSAQPYSCLPHRYTQMMCSGVTMCFSFVACFQRAPWSYPRIRGAQPIEPVGEKENGLDLLGIKSS